MDNLNILNKYINPGNVLNIEFSNLKETDDYIVITVRIIDKDCCHERDTLYIDRNTKECFLKSKYIFDKYQDDYEFVFCDNMVHGYKPEKQVLLKDILHLFPQNCRSLLLTDGELKYQYYYDLPIIDCILKMDKSLVDDGEIHELMVDYDKANGGYRFINMEVKEDE